MQMFNFIFFYWISVYNFQNTDLEFGIVYGKFAFLDIKFLNFRFYPQCNLFSSGNI